MPKRLFIIDAFAFIYRSYYAFLSNPRINSSGMNTSAIWGFVTTIRELIRERQPTHLAVVFDPQGQTFRHKIYSQYKAHRHETPEDIRKAIPVIKEIIEAYKIPIFQVDGFEADDVIGTLAQQVAKTTDITVFIMTSDKDLGQLVSDNIYLYRPRSNSNGYETLGVKEIKEKFDIESPQQIVDYLGLRGDPIDNIPGCMGIGPKTAVMLLKEYGSVENILQNTHQLKGVLRKRLEANRDIVLCSKILATIKTDVPISVDIEDLVRKEPDRELLSKLFIALEFRAMSKFMDQSSSTSVVTFSSAPVEMQQSLFSDAVTADETTVHTLEHTLLQTVTTVPHRYHIVNTHEGIVDLVERLNRSEEFCFSTETTSVNVQEAGLVGISFAVEPQEAFYVPIPEQRAEAEQVLSYFKDVFSSQRLIIGHNIKFDLAMLTQYGITIGNRLFDTMIAHYLLHPEQGHAVDHLAEVLLKYRSISIENLVGKKASKHVSRRRVPLNAIAEYAAEKADITLQIKQILNPLLRENGVDELFYDIEIPLMRVLARMERNGMSIDSQMLKHLSKLLTSDMLRIECDIHYLVGSHININSPRQVGQLLFDYLHIGDNIKKTRTGQYVTDEETLETLRDKHLVVSQILDYRSIKKMLSTYIDAFPKLISPHTGKLHTTFNQTVTVTGRLSSSSPNLQNIPIRDEIGRKIRKVFIAEQGCLLLAADYSQIELRIMAHLSKDEHMIAAFNANQDIHSATAAKIFKVPLGKITEDMRRTAKVANFGIIYGISSFGLSERLSISRQEAKVLINGYFESFPKVKQFINESIKQANEKGYVETILHRKRYLPDIKSNNGNVRGFAERTAVNAPIQGTAADIIKIAMVRIDNKIDSLGLKTKMILQVHDELVFNVPDGEIDIVKALVTEEMEHAVELIVPLKAEVGVGKNWFEAH
jgi:DNA polymerase-1